MISFIITALKIVFLLGFLILIHEAGHFFVAKLCKVKVNEFAIGFGPTIWKKQSKETKYALRLIPLGGFVNMEGEEERSDAEGSFSTKSIPKRIAIVVAGGAVNIVFGLIVYYIIAVSTTQYISNIVDENHNFDNNQIAYFQPGDEILKVNGKKIHSKTDIDKYMEQVTQESVSVTIKRDNQIQNLNIKPLEENYSYVGIYFDSAEQSSTEVVAIYPGSPSDIAGLETGDVILKVNEQDIQNDPYKVVNELNENKNEIIPILVDRKGEQLIIEVTPEFVTRYYLGVTLKEASNDILTKMYYAFWDTGEFSVSIIENLQMLFTGKVSTDQLMGPIGISDVVADTNSFADYMYILALISLSLGVTNLLPFPPLDGGKVVILIIEGIRKKPLKENIEIGIQMTGFAILILLSIYVAYNDILRIF